VKKPEVILKENPGSIIFARYADQLAQKGKIEDAIEILEKGIEANPSYALGHSVLAHIFHSQKSGERAEREWSKALELDPQISRDLVYLGKYFLQINQPRKAKEYFLAAARFEPRNAEIQEALTRATALSKTGDDLGLSKETAGALSEVLEEKKKPAELVETQLMETDEGIMELVEDEPVDMDALLREMQGKNDTSAQKEVSEEEESPSVWEDEGTVSDEISDEGIILKADRGVDGSDAKSLLASAYESGEKEEAESEQEDIDLLLESYSGKGIQKEISPETETGESTGIEEGAEEGFDDIDFFESLVEKPQDKGNETADEERIPDETSETGDEDIESLFESFTGEDVEIEAPEATGPEESAGIGEIEDKDFEDTGETAITEKEIPPEEPEEKDEKGSMAGGAGFPDEEYKKGVDRLMSFYEDVSGEETALESIETLEETESEGEEEGPMGILADFKGIEISDESEPEQSTDSFGKDIPILEIDDIGEYNPTDFELEPVTDELEEPVISEEERAELLALEEAPEEEAGDFITGDETEKGKESDWNSPLKELLDECDSSETEKVTEEAIPEGFYGELSKEEIDILSDNRVGIEEGTNQLELETREGIDYSDVLASAAKERIPDIEGHLEEISPDKETAVERESEESPEKTIKPPSMILDMTQIEIAEEDQSGVPDFSFDEEIRISDEELSREYAVEERVDKDLETVLETQEEVAEPVDEDFKLVENMINETISDFEMPPELEETYDVSNISLDTLLEEYIEILNESPEESEPVISHDESHESSIEIDIQADDGDHSVIESDATATMAEIYVSQGFLSRAIEIYTILLKGNPDNEHLKKRLEELKSMTDQPSADT
jgi:tetratricopeptide (TPR) repeat protein